MKRHFAWSGAAALVAVALAGCVRTTVDTTLNSDDTFSQHSIVAFSDTVAAQVGDQAGFDVANLREQLEDSPELDELEERFPGQITVEEYDDGELRGVEITISDVPVDEFNTTATQTGTGLTGGASISRVDDTFVVEMILPQDVSLADAGVTESQLELFASSVDISVSYTFPGPVESTTAGTIEGHTVTLGLTDLVSGEDIRIVGSAKDSINWQPILTWGGIGLAFLLVLGGATALVIQDRRTSLRNNLPPIQTATDPTGPGVVDDPDDPGDDNDGENGEGHRANP